MAILPTAQATPDAPLSPETLKRKRLLAEALLKEGMDYSPIMSPWQGAARLVSALAGGSRVAELDRQEREGMASANKSLADILQREYGGGDAAAAPAAGGAAPAAAAGGGRSLPTFAQGDLPYAIKSTESSNNYAAIGPTHPKYGRALGAYQIMETNLPQWSREALGREVTSDEFLASPQLQDQIAQAKMGQYYQKYGNPQDVASMWFSGRPVAQAGNRRDSLGTTVPGYVQRVMARLDPNAAQPGTQVASADPNFVPRPTGMFAYAAPQAPMTMPSPSQQAVQPPQESAAAPQESAAAPSPGALPAMAGGGQQMQMPQQVAQLQPEVAKQIAQTASNPQVQAAAQQTAQTPAGQQIARAAQGAPLATILTAMQNPWLTDGQKSILLMVAKEKLSGQYGFQTLPDGTIMRTDARRGTIEPIYQAPVKPVTLGADQRLVDPNTGKEVVGAAGGNTTDQKDYERAVKQGYKGTFMDYQIAMANAKRPVNKTEGTIPPGYRAVRDADGNIVSLELIPGSKEAKAEENQQKAGKQTADTVLDAVDRIDKRMNSTVFPSTGGFGNVLSSIPGTAAHDVSNLVETLKSNISIDQLNRMRQMSPTGGALGSVTEGEHRLLAASVASLAQSQSAQQFKENLARVRQRYLEIVHGQKAGAGAGQNDPLGIR